MGSKALQLVSMAERPERQSRPLALLSGGCADRASFEDPRTQILNSAPVTPLANGQWEARARDLPVSPSPMPEAGLSDPSVRRAGPARRTALPHLKTSIPAEQPRLRWAGRKETGKPTMLFGESHLPS